MISLRAHLFDAAPGQAAGWTVTELRENTSMAQITSGAQLGTEVEVDSRSVGCIAIALRAGAAIFASDEVIEEPASSSRTASPTSSRSTSRTVTRMSTGVSSAASSTR